MVGAGDRVGCPPKNQKRQPNEPCAVKGIADTARVRDTATQTYPCRDPRRSPSLSRQRTTAEIHLQRKVSQLRGQSNTFHKTGVFAQSRGKAVHILIPVETSSR